MPAEQKALWDVRKAGLNIMMSMKGDGKPVSFIEDCAVPARAPRRVHRRSSPRSSASTAPQGTFYAHASVGLPARAPGPQHEGRRHDPHARHRRGGRRPGAPLQGRVFGRARRRAGALGVDRALLRPAAHGGALRDQGLVRPEGAHEPRQDREPAEAGRSLALSLQAGLPRRGAGDRARLERVGRLRGRRRDVQQQRPLPQVRRRNDVPELSRDRRRGAPHARPRQHASPRALGAAGRGRVRLARRFARPSTCASRARAAGASARRAWTWRA